MSGETARHDPDKGAPRGTKTATVEVGEDIVDSTPRRRGGRKPIATKSKKLTMILPEVAHARLEELAEERGGVPLAEVLRRAFQVFDTLDRLLSRTPGGELGIYDPRTGNWYPVEVPVGRSAL